MNPFKVDYTNLVQVKEFADSMAARDGIKYIVYKHPSRNNYNITFDSRLDQYCNCVVVHRTN